VHLSRVNLGGSATTGCEGADWLEAARKRGYLGIAGC
jgi:hypothetical protein